MKLSSISLIAAALAAIAGSVTAAPTPHPFEHVDIYSRADIHHAIAVNLEAASRAGAIGWHEHAKVHENRHQQHSKSRTHDPEHLKWSIEQAHKTIERVEHEEAASLNQQAAHNYWRRGKEEEARFHQNFANQNKELAFGDTQYPHFAALSKSWAYKASHAEAAALNRHAANIARKRGSEPLAKSHEDLVSQNSRLAFGHTQDPRFAETSKKLAYQTFHAQAALLGRIAAHQAGSEQLAQIHRDIPNRNARHPHGAVIANQNAGYARAQLTGSETLAQIDEAIANQNARHPHDAAHLPELPILAKFHDDNADRNVGFIRGDKADPCVAEISAAAAGHTIVRHNCGSMPFGNY